MNVPSMIVLTELAPIYRTIPLSTTSFNALMVSALGVARSSLWICNTSINVPSLWTLFSTASKMCFLLSPTRFTIAPSLIELTATGG